MTNISDDRLVEDYFDDPISLKKFDHLAVIDLDNIDATIEDPGYILNEVPKFNKTEEFTSSYKKQSFTLPVRFFDISNNIRLLKKCRPISIQIVDCDIYPWYYRKIRYRINSSNVICNKNEDANSNKLSHDTIDFIDLTCSDTCLEGSFDSITSTIVPKLNLSSEQRSAVLKLKEKIENQIIEVNKNTIDVVDNENATLKNYEDTLLTNKVTSERHCDKNTEPHDLLTYQTIAQSIVRKIEIKQLNNKTNSTCVQNSSVFEVRENSGLMNVEIPDKYKVENKPEQKQKILTVPVSPYSIKPPKTTKQKEKRRRKSPKANDAFEKSRKCNFLTSLNQVIPHYHLDHFKLPVSECSNENFCYPNMHANQMHSQKLIPKDPFLNFHEPINKYDILSVNSALIPAHSSQERLVTSPHGVQEISMRSLNEKLCKSPIITSSRVEKDQSCGNINSNIHTSHFRYPISVPYQYNKCTTSEYPRQDNLQNSNSLRYVRRPNVLTSPYKSLQVNTENYRVCPQASASQVVDDNYIPNSMNLLNEYVNYNRTQIPLQGNVTTMTNKIQSNPLLTRLLNCNNWSEYNQSVLEKNDGLSSRPVVRRILPPHPSMEQGLWLPPRPPPPPPPSYDFYLSSTQFTQDKNVQNANAEMHLPSFINNNSNFKQLVNNPKELLGQYNNLQNVPMNVPNITESVLPKIDFMKRNICAHTEFQSKKVNNEDSLRSYRDTDPNMCININAKTNNRNIINVPPASSQKDIPISNRHSIYTATNVLRNEKSDCLHSKINNCNVLTENKLSLLKKITINSIEPPDSCQFHTKSRIVTASDMYNMNLQSTKDTNNGTSEQVESKVIKGYSPPILPIPSYKKSLEMLSESQHMLGLNLAENNNLEAVMNKEVRNTSKQNRNNQNYTKTPRKRKLNNDKKNNSNSKRI